MISRSQMNRQLYNMGGEGIMQVAPQQDSMPSDMQGEQYRPVAENLANDPKQAIEVIVKMLMEQGIPEEEARRIAMEMIQTVAQTGSLEEFDNEERVEARFGGRMGYADGGIGSLVNREQYGLGSIGKIFKKATSIPRAIVKGVKKVAQSPIGRIALTIGATYALGGIPALSGSSFAAGAMRAGLANLAVQAVSGQGINLKEGLIAAGLGGLTSSMGAGTGAEASGAGSGYGTSAGGEFAGVGLGNPTNMPSDVFANIGDGGFTEPFISSVSEQAASFSPTDYSNIAGAQGGEFATPGMTIDYTKAAQDVAKTSSGGIMDTLKGYATSAKDYVGGLYDKGIGLVKEYPLTSLAVAGGTGAILGSQQIPERMPGESDAEYQARVDEYQSQYDSNLRQNQSGLLPSSANNPFYAANGGRIGYAFGDLVRSSGVVSAAMNAGDAPSSDISGSGMGGLLARLIRNNPNIFSVVKNTPSPLNTMQKLLARYYGNVNPTLNSEEVEKYAREKAAYGGRMGYAYGSVDEGIMAAPQIANMMGMPVGNPRQNQQGVAELDYRDQGGFVPPIGIKEKADDIPAMLSNNEFVFTANAVKNADPSGNRDPEEGAKVMYRTMKMLENGGMV
jgi:hypothetical protein